MTAEEQMELLTEQLEQALKQLQQTTEQLQATQEALQKAQARIAEMEKRETFPLSFVKANAKKQPAAEKKTRQKCEAQFNRARKLAVAMQIEEHRIVACPDCHLRLGGMSLARVQKVIDVPPPPGVEVTYHQHLQGMVFWLSALA